MLWCLLQNNQSKERKREILKFVARTITRRRSKTDHDDVTAFLNPSRDTPTTSTVVLQFFVLDS